VVSPRMVAAVVASMQFAAPGESVLNSPLQQFPRISPSYPSQYYSHNHRHPRRLSCFFRPSLPTTRLISRLISTVLRSGNEERREKSWIPMVGKPPATTLLALMMMILPPLPMTTAGPLPSWAARPLGCPLLWSGRYFSLAATAADFAAALPHYDHPHCYHLPNYSFLCRASLMKPSPSPSEPCPNSLK